MISVTSGERLCGRSVRLHAVHYSSDRRVSCVWTRGASQDGTVIMRFSFETERLEQRWVIIAQHIAALYCRLMFLSQLVSLALRH